MKLRQKLAMVLASAMIVTAVPVTTMAASTNSLSHTMIMVEGTTVGYKKTTDTNSKSTFTTVDYHPQLQLKISEDVNIEAKDGTTFYINAKDATFIKGAFLAAENGGTYGPATGDEIKAEEAPVINLTYTTTSSSVTTNATATAKWLSGDQIEINVKDPSAVAGSTLTLRKGEVLSIPLYMEAKKGNPGVEIQASNSVFSASAFTLTSQTVGDKTLTAKVGDVPKITINGGDLATITVTENIVKALENKGVVAGDTDKTDANTKARTVKIKLPNSSELEFASKEITLTGKYGFSGQEVILKADGAYTVKDGKADTKIADAGVYKGCKFKVDGNNLEVVLPAWVASGNTFGAIEISGVTVEPESRNGAKVADVKATISGDMLTDVAETVATVKEFDAEVTCEPVDIIAGKDAKKATIKVVENVADVINERDEILFTMDEGFVVELIKGDSGYEIVDMPTAKLKKDSDEVTNGHFTKEDVKNYLLQEKVVETSTNIKVTDVILEQITKTDFHVIGFVTEAVDGKFETDKANTLEVKMNVQAALGTKDGEINVKVENRGIETQEVLVAKYTQPFAVTSEGVALKTGLRGQTGGKIVITEKDKEMLVRNGELTITVKDEDGDITIKGADITVNGARIKEKSKTFGTGISFVIDRASDEAAEIVIENIVFDTNRSVPEGSYDVVVSGSALKSTNTKDTDKCGGIELEDFITISTKNTEDIQDAATVKEVVLAVGNTTYTVDGQEKTATVAPFIDAQNRVMVPLRLVSEEFGANVDFGVLNGVGTVTIQKEGTTVQFQNKSKVMNKNGILVPMDTEAVIKEGTTYVPLRYLANALNIDLTWDDATKTITFAN